MSPETGRGSEKQWAELTPGVVSECLDEIEVMPKDHPGAIRDRVQKLVMQVLYAIYEGVEDPQGLAVVAPVAASLLPDYPKEIPRLPNAAGVTDCFTADRHYFSTRQKKSWVSFGTGSL